MQEIQNAAKFLESLNSAKDLRDDISQFQRNIAVIRAAYWHLLNHEGSNEHEVEKCITEINNKYGNLISIGNCIITRGQVVRKPLDYTKTTYAEKVDSLIDLTKCIPIYVCLREKWNEAIKHAYKQILCTDIDDTDIKRAKGEMP